MTEDDFQEATVYGWLADDPENADCIVCGEPVNLATLIGAESLCAVHGAHQEIR